MRKFRFNLQRALDHREMIEDIRLAELAAIVSEHERELARHAEMERSRNVFSLKIRNGSFRDDPDEMRRAREYLHCLAELVQAQEDRVKTIAEQRDIKTLEVMEASKDRKALDRLREYKLAAHRLETQRLEQAFLDDVAGVRHRRQKGRAQASTGGLT